jgi:hypothetical protein
MQDNTRAAVSMSHEQLRELLHLGMTRNTLIASRSGAMFSMMFFGLGRGDDARDFNVSDIMEPGDVKLVGE